VADHTYRGGITDKQMCEAVKRAKFSLMGALLELVEGNMEPMDKLQDKLRDICGPSISFGDMQAALAEPDLEKKYEVAGISVSMTLRRGTSDVQSCGEVFDRRDYKSLFETIDATTSKDIIVFDLGGYIGDTGLWALATLRNCRMPLKLVVYEPDEDNMTLCRTNFAQNKAWLDEMGAQRELVRAAALTNDAPQAQFNRNKSAYNNYRHSATHKVVGENNTEVVIVPARNFFQDVAQELARHKFAHVFIKIDIEGGEFPIIDNMEHVVRICEENGAHQLVCVIEYSLDLERCLDLYRQRLRKMRHIFDEVKAKRAYLEERTDVKMWPKKCANNADIWTLRKTFQR